MCAVSTIVIKGPFTSDELTKIAQAVCQAEAQRPTETFEVYVNAPHMQGEVDSVLDLFAPLRYGYERVVKYGRRKR
jgi:ATP-dependent protease ClpP protease subunit